MKAWKSGGIVFPLLLAAILLSPVTIWACGVENGVPKNYFDGVNEQGQLSYWRQLGEIDFGGGIKLPLNINFRSDREFSSPYLGRGWMLSPIETSFVQLGDNEFLMIQPNGSRTRFWRDVKNSTLLHGQGTWLASITGSNTITVWASCGWKMAFIDGKVQSVSTPQNQQIVFNYQNGRVVDVGMNGHSILTIQTDLGTGLVSGLTYNDKKIAFSQDKRPRIEAVQGKELVANFDQSLHKVTLTDGASETYDFGVNAQMQPTLKINGLSERSFTWDPISMLLLKDGEWTYSIRQGKSAFEKVAVARVDSSGRKEFWFVEENEGKEVEEKKDGINQITTWFVSGPFAGKIKAISQNIKGVQTIDLKYTYDENGKVISISNKATNFKETNHYLTNEEISEFNFPPNTNYSMEEIQTQERQIIKILDENNNLIYYKTVNKKKS